RRPGSWTRADRVAADLRRLGPTGEAEAESLLGRSLTARAEHALARESRRAAVGAASVGAHDNDVGLVVGRVGAKGASEEQEPGKVALYPHREHFERRFFLDDPRT